jgi:putative esterase
MRSLTRIVYCLVLSPVLLSSTIRTEAKAGTSPSGWQSNQGAGQAPPTGAPAVPPGGQRGQMALSSATPLAETENLDAYPAAPEGFNVARANSPQGELNVVEYDSKTLGLRRLLRVYTPPGYNANRKYPVLYLHHGLGNTSTEWTQRARAPIIIDNLLADKKIEPFIIVFPSGNATATPGDEKQGDRTQASYGTPYDRFAWIAAVAAAPNTKPPAELVPDPAALKSLKLLWLSVGNRDNLLRVSRGVHEYLKKGWPISGASIPTATIPPR